MNAPAQRPLQQGLVVVRTDDQLSFEVIAELLVDAGYAAARVCQDDRSSFAGAVAAIWDSPLSIAEDRGSLANFAKRLWPAPTIALVGFLREADRQLAVECGASAALGKPLLITELLDELESARSVSHDRTTVEYRETA
jgi:AmiR/NasT family two-component response regulator